MKNEFERFVPPFKKIAARIPRIQHKRLRLVSINRSESLSSIVSAALAAWLETNS